MFVLFLNHLCDEEQTQTIKQDRRVFLNHLCDEE
ncbi:hypothetical protein F911_03043, partial [Acinetobacter baumannii ATCC 19606 = CIP 70.34 = JCM 6841]